MKVDFDFYRYHQFVNVLFLNGRQKYLYYLYTILHCEGIDKVLNSNHFPKWLLSPSST